MKRHILPLAMTLMIISTLEVSATPLIQLELAEAKRALTRVELGRLDIATTIDGTFHIVGWPADLDLLNSRGARYTTLIEDLEANFVSCIESAQRENSSKALSALQSNVPDYEFALFASYDEIVAWRESLLSEYPSLVSTPDTLGYTIEGRPIWAIKMSDNPNVDEEEPEIFLNGAIHAREVITPLVLMGFADSLLSKYGTDAQITNIVNEREIWILPVINIDGYLYNEQYIADGYAAGEYGFSLWRKNRRPLEDDNFGVDLNRNFPFKWGYDNFGSSPRITSSTYRGSSPASEPETEAIVNFINSHNFTGVINYHSYSNLMLIPWSYTYEPHPWRALYEALTDSINRTLDWAWGGAEALYACNGEASDWQASGGLENGADYKMFTYVIEVGTYQEGGFWPRSTEIRDSQVNGQYDVLLNFCEVTPGLTTNLGYLLAPGIPSLSVSNPADNDLLISWEPVDGEFGNVATSFDLIEYSDIEYGDNVESTDLHFWKDDTFSGGSIVERNGSNTYFSGNQSDLVSILSSILPFKVPVEGGDFIFDTFFRIEEGWDYAYVQVSTDGENWINLTGEITDDDGGITGWSTEYSADGGVTAAFPLDQFSGEEIYLRIQYVTDGSVNEGGMYVDNITWVAGYRDESQLAAGTTETSFTISDFSSPDGEPVFFKIRAIDEEDDCSDWSSVVRYGDYSMTTNEASSLLPSRFTFEPPFPNPFNPTTRLTVKLSQTSRLHLSVVNILGQRVADRDLGQYAAGTQSFELNGSNWSSGLFLVRITATSEEGISETRIRKVVLLK